MFQQAGITVCQECLIRLSWGETIRRSKRAARSARAVDWGRRACKGVKPDPIQVAQYGGMNDSMTGLRRWSPPGCPGDERRAAGRVAAIARDPC
jgi:hypothetical protein